MHYGVGCMGEWTAGRRWITWINSEKVAEVNDSEYGRIMRHIGSRRGGVQLGLGSAGKWDGRMDRNG